MSRGTQTIFGMVGVVLPFAGAAAPAGWLLCHGQAVSRTDYAHLFSVVGTTFGAGNGTTTFNVPDLRGEFIRGADNGAGVDVGRTLGSKQAHASERHNHYLPTGTENVAVDPGPCLPDSLWVFNREVNAFPSSGTVAQTIGIGGKANLQDSQGSMGSWATENRPRNVAMNHIIKI